MDLGGSIVADDILCEIIKRLPVKDVLRFMCVSKPWNNLINNPFFITSHLQFNKQSPNDHSHAVLGLTVRVSDKGVETDQQFEFFRVDNTHKTTLEHITTQFPWTLRLHPRPQPRMYWPRFQEVRIVGHCNGLVCALDTQTIIADPDYIPRKSFPKELYDLERYIICNPITRRFHILPESDIEVPDLTRYDNGDYEEWRYKELKGTGLGFVDNLVYRVVQVIYGIGQRSTYESVLHRKTYEPPRVEVYDSRCDSWRKVLIDNPEYSYEHLHNGVYNSFDGCMYWFGNGNRRNKPYWTLLSFDLVLEKWHESLFPHKDTFYEDDINCEESVFGEYGACLGVEISGRSVVMFVRDKRNPLVHNVWKMNKEDDNNKMCWTHMYRFCCCSSPQGFFRDGELLLKASEQWAFVECENNKLVLYDYKKMDEACHGFTDLGFRVGNIVPNFVESLLLLDGEMEAIEDAVEDALEATLYFEEEKEKKKEEEEEKREENEDEKEGEELLELGDLFE